MQTVRIEDFHRHAGEDVSLLPVSILNEVLAFSGNVLKDDVALLAVSPAD